VIKTEIFNFWEGVDVKKDKLQLDSDQMIMLFVYITCLARIKNLLAHIQFCKEFSTPYITQTRFGYCMTTMEVALMLLADEKDLVSLDPVLEEANDENMFDLQIAHQRKSIKN
jgi:hypothetical protein